MKIKLIKDIMIDEKAYLAGKVFEVSDEHAKELVETGKAVEYVAPIEIKEITEEVKEAVVVEVTKEVAKEVKKEIVIEVKDEGPVYKSLGEMIQDIHMVSSNKNAKADQKEKAFNRLEKASGQNETTAADGGYLVPDDFLNEVQEQARDKNPVFDKCRKISTMSDNIKIPASAEQGRDFSNVSASIYGGWVFTSTAEAAAITASKKAFTEISIDVNKIAALGYVTSELMQDSNLINQTIMRDLSEGMAATVASEILVGTQSVGTPVTGATGCVGVTVTAAAATLAQLNSMFLQCNRRSTAEWYMNIDAYADLLVLADAGSNSIFAPVVTGTPSGTLWGRPINIVEESPATGTDGAIIFGDFSRYAVVTKSSGLVIATSPHYKFNTDEIAIRATYRVGLAPLDAYTVEIAGLERAPLVYADYA